VEAAHPAAREKLKFNEALRHTVNFLASDLVSCTKLKVQHSGIASLDDIRRSPNRLAVFSEHAAHANASLKLFLFKHIYNHPAITEDRDRSVRCLEELFAYYLDSPGSMPASHEESARTEPRHIVVCDYIAGMTDQFLLRKHQEHFGSFAAST
jgi:dGTPase